MPRTDVDVVARAIRREHLKAEMSGSRAEAMGIRNAARAVAADLLERDPTFDSIAFLKACGLTDDHIPRYRVPSGGNGGM